MRNRNFSKRFWIVSSLVFLAASAGWGKELTSTNAITPVDYELRLGTERIRFNPGSKADLQRLAIQMGALLENAPKKNDRSRLRTFAKKYRRGLQQIQRLAEAAAVGSEADETHRPVDLLLEVVAAVNNNQRSPVPEHIDAIQSPWVVYKQMHHPMARGHTPAVNLAAGTVSDLSRLDPQPSTFWEPRENIPNRDIYAGFGRTNWLRLEDELCDYSAAKESFGTNPGFEVECRGLRIKLKFAEVSSEPFVARIFSVLGYHVDATDHAARANVRYDRRLLQEFNSRQEMKTRFTAFGFLPAYVLKVQRRYDPFDYIAGAVLRDGRQWSGQELRSQLFHDPRRRHPEAEAANFRTDIESQIDHLVTVPANVQVKDPEVKSIGPWDFGQLDHANRRELRGAGLLAAWLGWFDTRADNTRLRIVRRGGQVELLHYFSDLGGGLGRTTGLLFWKGERPNDFPWTFTRPAARAGKDPSKAALKIEGYKPMAATPAFAAMTRDDARWMARLIGQITEDQIVQALIASGYDSAEVRLYAEKLLSRRDRMVIDLGLSEEILLLRPAGFDRKFSYDPVADGPMSTGSVRSRVTGTRIVEGKLVSGAVNVKR